MYSLRFKYRCVCPFLMQVHCLLFALYRVHSFIRCSQLLFFYIYFEVDSFFNLPFVRWFVHRMKPPFKKLSYALPISKSSIDSAKWDKVGVGSRVIFKQRNLIVEYTYMCTYVSTLLKNFIIFQWHWQKDQQTVESNPTKHGTLK